MAYYFDTSALVKLVVAEPESAALREWLDADDVEPVSSDLARTELMRAVRRVVPEEAPAARAVLDSIPLLALDADTYDAAGRLDPAIVRTLDAVHLAAALELGDDLEGFVTYDDRLAMAVSANGVAVVAPV